MNKLSLISFVGVDTHTNMEDLLKMESAIHCEFSVLFSDSKSIQSHTRYPSYKFCKDFIEWGALESVTTSVHLCGSVIDRYLKQEQDVLELCRLANRIQLNLNISNYSDYEKLSDEIIANIDKYGHHVILQKNKTKEKFMECFMKKNKHPISLLHDSSGGFGREITEVSAPADIGFTGYAGGINPGNAAKIVGLIETANTTGKEYYIDMESGVRTNNIFSLEKCQQVINAVQ